MNDHDKRRAQLRHNAREDLINVYIERAIQNASGLIDDDGEPIGLGFLNIMGQEVPDPTVVEPPLGYVAQPDLMEQMRRMLRVEFSRLAQTAEMETFEEADDFDIDDDPVDYSSPYEEYFDPLPGQPAGPPAGSGNPDPNATPAPDVAPGSPPADPSA